MYYLHHKMLVCFSIRTKKRTNIRIILKINLFL